MATETISQQNTIAKGTTVTGDIISDGDFRIEGTLQGNIKTSGKVVIGKSGIINGTLKSTNADVEGKFSGKLLISGLLSLKSSAHVEGEAEVGKLAVEIDATFNATCVMKGALKELNNGSRTGQQSTIQRPTGQQPEKGQSA
ncbi:polymer-forming cytoskeletal protein [Psychroserpens sp. XS_ASV72]|uniref:bactofilin family protein n=1 Tax=Psychroserpens sp. XS_ASV72 TaxID=3241293 RepID=UPI003517F7B1